MMSDVSRNRLYRFMIIAFEPRHDKTNDVSVCPAKTEISLGIRPFWSESSLSAWRKLGFLATQWAQAKTLIRLGGCPDWSESSLGAQSLCWFCRVAAHFYLLYMIFVWFVVSSQRAFSPTLCHNGLVTTFEPRHDKTNIRPVWSESSLSAWRNLWSLATHWAHSEDSDQTGRMPRLIWVFAGRTLVLLVCHAVAHFSTLLRGAGGKRLFLSVAFHGGVFILFYSVNRKYALQFL